MTNSILKTSAIALTLLALSGSIAFAENTNYGTNPCQPIYGGGQSCVKNPQFEINKTVKNPQTGQFVDNLTVSDVKFGADQIVVFKLTVKNTTNTELKNIVIKDTLPDFVDFVDGMGGTFDQNSKTITIKLDSLKANESRDFFVQVRVRTQDKLPSDKNTVCLINQSSMIVDTKQSQDNATFCVEKGIVTPTPSNPGNPSNPSNPSNPNNPGNPSNPNNPTTKGGIPVNPGVNPPMTKGGLPVYPPTTASTTPGTGPESIALIGLIPSAVGGLFLRRKSK